MRVTLQVLKFGEYQADIVNLLTEIQARLEDVLPGILKSFEDGLPYITLEIEVPFEKYPLEKLLEFLELQTDANPWLLTSRQILKASIEHAVKDAPETYSKTQQGRNAKYSPSSGKGYPDFRKVSREEVASLKIKVEKFLSDRETGSEIKATEVREKFKLDPTRTRVILHELIDDGKLIYTGKAKATRYYWRETASDAAFNMFLNLLEERKAKVPEGRVPLCLLKRAQEMNARFLPKAIENPSRSILNVCREVMAFLSKQHAAKAFSKAEICAAINYDIHNFHPGILPSLVAWGKIKTVSEGLRPPLYQALDPKTVTKVETSEKPSKSVLKEAAEKLMVIFRENPTKEYTRSQLQLIAGIPYTHCYEATVALEALDKIINKGSGRKSRFKLAVKAKVAKKKVSKKKVSKKTVPKTKVPKTKVSKKTVPQKKVPKRINWSKYPLGKMSDPDLAKKYGFSRSRVLRARQSLNIPSYKGS